jgi:hypothetical protein
MAVQMSVTVTDTRSKKVLLKNDNWVFRDVFDLAQTSADFVPEDPAAMGRLSQNFAASFVETLLHAKLP